MELDELLSSLIPGETVLVEYSSEIPPEVFLLALVRWAKEGLLPLVIDDVLDTLEEYVSRLSLRGVNVEPLLSSPVIKVGGTSQVGDVKGTVDVDKHSFDFKYYESIYTKSRRGELVINPVLGFYKLFLATTDREMFRLVRNVASYVGRRDRIALYFVNRDVVDSRLGGFGHLLREISTTILVLGFEEGAYKVRVVKSPRVEFVGKVFRVG